MHYLLIHSPLVGPATWAPVAEQLAAAGHRTLVPSLAGLAAAPPPRWQFAIDRVLGAMDAAAAPWLLVGHSGAGALLPGIGQALAGRVAAYLFVDAALPPTHEAYTLEPEFLAHLRTLAVAGRLPPWSRWWGQDVLHALVPDEQVRARLEAELPELPLAYFEDPIPVPAGWDQLPVGYIRFSEPYQATAQAAASRGYLVAHLPGGHLHAVVEPRAVAERMVTVAEHLVNKGKTL